MRQKLRSHVTFANVVSLIALSVALGGTTYAATGGNFILGQSNSASSTTALSSGTTGPAFKVTSTNTAAGATALRLNAASGHAPFTVNSGTKVANLNADKLDGLDSTAFLGATAKAADADKLDGLDSTSIGARKLVFSAARGTGLQEIADVGAYIIEGACPAQNGTTVQIAAFVNTTSGGTVDVMFGRTENDATDLGTESRGLLLPFGSDIVFADIAEGTANSYKRIAGTAMIKKESVLIQVDFNAVADNRGSGSCFIYGTATNAI
jgi:hypothetical protein